MNKIEAELKQIQDSLAFALESGRMGTWDFDLVTDKIICSKEMLRIWGITESQFDGQRSLLQSKVHPEDRPLMVEAIAKAIEEKSVYEFEYRIFPEPGNLRWVVSRGRCTYAPDSDLPVRFAGVVFDITEKKIKEEALAAAVKARDQFFMIASHELKTPLTCLNLQIDVLQWEMKERFPELAANERIDSGFKKQQEHLLRISRIIDNILHESKLSDKKLSLHPEKFCLQTMVLEVLDRFRVASDSAGVEITLTKTESLEGTWDKYKIEQVLLNLLTNAIKYGNQSRVCVEVSGEKGFAHLVVKDEGPGIDPLDQERIFERFERVLTDKKIAGLGLGLYLSNSIVRAHGGEILLHSEVGKGSEFRVILPVEFSGPF